ncbi:MAG: hypothetical protein JWM19_910 [Actinomycetia bacterium]|nr:hypothetical protein [Actinomycetes bacterium]
MTYEFIPYDPVSGSRYSKSEAVGAWSSAMSPSRARWDLKGGPGTWRWVFFSFGTWTGQVTISNDGFHWKTFSYDTGEELLSGVTTSLYEAYNSVEKNRLVSSQEAT